MSKENPIEAGEIPPHMLEGPRSAAQEKVFGKAKASSPTRGAKKSSAKKASKRAGKKQAGTEAPVWPEDTE